MAAFDVSGGADDCQGVDAGKAKEQREEAIHLREDRKRGERGTRKKKERKVKESSGERWRIKEKKREVDEKMEGLWKSVDLMEKERKRKRTEINRTGSPGLRLHLPLVQSVLLQTVCHLGLDYCHTKPAA